MRLDPRTFTARDGRTCVIRSARGNDAGRVLDHVWEIHTKDPEFQVASAEELKLTASQMRGLLKKLEQGRDALFLLAEVDGGVCVATVSFHGSHLEKMRHDAALGISVRRAWRRQGLGRALMVDAIEAARASPLRRLSLKAFSTNEPALALYRALGFREEGRLVERVRQPDGYVDEIHMALDVR